MFDLTRAIRAWRSEVEFAIGAGDDAEELESHLRELIDWEVARGRSPAEAYARAARRMGAVADIEREYLSLEFGFLKSARRALTRSRVGVVRALDLSVLAWLALLLGPFVLYVMLRSLLLLRRHWSEFTLQIHAWPMLVFMWVGIAGACMAVLPASVRYLRGRYALSARAVVAFHSFVAFLICFTVLQRSASPRGINITNPTALTFGLYGISLLLGVLVWSFYLRRLAAAAHLPTTE